MVQRREFLRAVTASGVLGLAGCNTSPGDDSDEASPRSRTPTTTLNPPQTTISTNPSGTAPTQSRPDATTPSSVGTSIPDQRSTATVAEEIGTAVYRPDNGIDEFGQAVALAADVAIVVAEEHGAFVFEVDGDGWTNTAVLSPDDRDDFGGHEPAISLVGDEVHVGGPEAGAVYLYERTQDGWYQRQRFAPEDTEAGEFGRSVSSDGERLVVGDANNPTTMVSYVGGAYIYARADGTWTRETAFTTGEQDLFGTAVAIDGNTTLVGAPFARPVENRTGAAYVYERIDETWRQQAVLYPDDPKEIAYEAMFGQAVALEGGTAVVGAPEVPRGAGRAFVFEREGSDWRQTARLQPPDIEESDEFGDSVAIADSRLIVGAPHAREVGRAYAYTTNDSWSEPLRLTASNPQPDVEFGAAVAIADETALVGAPAYQATSGAYLFDLQG